MGFLGFAIWLSFGFYGYWIASIKRRPLVQGVVFGLLLGPLGCVIEATKRERSTEEVEESRSRREEELQARLELEKERHDALEAETNKRRQKAQIQADESRRRYAEIYGRVSEWVDRVVIKFGWFKALPEVCQPILVGLAVALPIIGVLIYLLKGK